MRNKETSKFSSCLYVIHVDSHAHLPACCLQPCCRAQPSPVKRKVPKRYLSATEFNSNNFFHLIIYFVLLFTKIYYVLHSEYGGWWEAIDIFQYNEKNPHTKGSKNSFKLQIAYQKPGGDIQPDKDLFHNPALIHTNVPAISVLSPIPRFPHQFNHKI